MISRKARAFTLIEIVVYSMLAMMVLGVVMSFFFVGQSNFEANSSSYLVSREAEVAVRWLQADLQEAALGSIRVYPNERHPGVPPGLSLASPRNLKNEFQTGDFGAPLWSTYVYYTLESNGNLVRWMEKHDFNGVPSASKKPPHETDGAKSSRVVLHNISQPGSELEGLATLSERGGLDLQFLRRTAAGDTVLTSWNPAQVTSGEASDSAEGESTRLVQLLLTMEMSNFRAGKTSYVQLPLRVFPRH